MFCLLINDMLDIELESVVQEAEERLELERYWADWRNIVGFYRVLEMQFDIYESTKAFGRELDRATCPKELLELAELGELEELIRKGVELLTEGVRSYLTSALGRACTDYVKELYANREQFGWLVPLHENLLSRLANAGLALAPGAKQ